MGDLWGQGLSPEPVIMSSGFFALQRKVRGEDCQASGRGSNKIRKEAWGERAKNREKTKRQEERSFS